MARRNEHLVVVMVEPPPTGEFEIWPLHITIVPWFHCEDEQKLNKVLAAAAARHQEFSVTAGKVEEWGKKEKFKVQLIDDPGELYHLHWDIFRSLEENGFPIHQKDFLGEQYKPHMALRNRFQSGHELPQGEQIKIIKFTLIKQKRLKKTGRMIKSVAKDYEL